jgi:hypothetical protein
MMIRVIGGGLAGPEAALQAAAAGFNVELFEMRPTRSTEAHQTADFAELVCSNSLKSESENSAPWLLKQEMRQAGSFLLREADACAVPAGHALAVDRVAFSARVAALPEDYHPAGGSDGPRSRPCGPYDSGLRTVDIEAADGCVAGNHRRGSPCVLRFHLAHRGCVHD